MSNNVVVPIKPGVTIAGDRDDGRLKNGGGGGNSNDMDRVWEKLAEHDKRFDRIEGRMDAMLLRMDDIARELSNAKFWFVGTALAIGLAGLGLMYAAQQNATATMGAALSAIQTVIADRPQQTTPPQPTVIVVPGPAPAAPPDSPPQQ